MLNLDLDKKKLKTKFPDQYDSTYNNNNIPNKIPQVRSWEGKVYADFITILGR